MFKKLKDKIAEEVKQSPLKSVQQLAQAVVSPSSSSVFEPSSSNDKFSIDEGDIEEDEKKTQDKPGGFTSVALTGKTTSPLHDQSYGFRPSIGSFSTESENLFTVFETQPTTFHVQSDWESASEVEDRYSQLEHINKESLYEAYRKVHNRYTKMKNKYQELVTHYRQLERENNKAKTVLSETQDKALLRISELRDQCLLEQQAKAHLEEALRNELEEQDHVINTLKTKVQYLKSLNDGTVTENLEIQHLSKDETENLIDFVEYGSFSKVPLPSATASNKENVDWFQKQLKKCQIILKNKVAEIETVNTKLEETMKKDSDQEETTKEALDSIHIHLPEQHSREDICLESSLISLINELTNEVKNLQEDTLHYLNSANKNPDIPQLNLIENPEEKSLIGKSKNSYIEISSGNKNVIRQNENEEGVQNNVDLPPKDKNNWSINFACEIEKDQCQEICSKFKECEQQNELLNQRLVEQIMLSEKLKVELSSLNNNFDSIKTLLKTTNENLKKGIFNIDMINVGQSNENDLIEELQYFLQNLSSTRSELDQLERLNIELENELKRIKTLASTEEVANEKNGIENKEKLLQSEYIIQAITLENERLKKELEGLKGQINCMLTQEERSSCEITELNRANVELKSQIKNLNQLLSVSQKEDKGTQEMSLEADKSMMEDKISHLEIDVENMKKDNLLLMESKEKLNNEVIFLSEENKSIASKYVMLEGKLEEVKEEKIRILELQGKLVDELNCLRKEHESVITEKNSLLKTKLKLEKDLENMKNDYTSVIEAKEQLSEAVASMIKRHDALIMGKNILKEKIKELEIDIENYKKENMTSLDCSKQLSEELIFLKKHQVELEREKYRLENAVDNLQKDFENNKAEYLLLLGNKDKLSEELALQKKEKDNLAVENGILTNKIETLEQNQDDCKSANIVLQSNIEDITKVFESKILEIKNKLSGEFEILKKEHDDLTVEKENLEKKLVKLEEDFKISKTKLLSSEEIGNELNSELVCLQKECFIKDEEITLLQTKLENSINEFEKSKFNENVLADQIESLRKEYVDAIIILNDNRKQLETKEDICTDLRAKLSELSEELKCKCEDMEVKYQENMHLKSDVEKLSKIISQTNADLEVVRKENNNIINTLSTTQFTDVKHIRQLQQNLFEYFMHAKEEIINELNDIKLKVENELMHEINYILDKNDLSGIQSNELECKNKKDIDSYNSKIKSLQTELQNSDENSKVQLLSHENLVQCKCLQDKISHEKVNLDLQEQYNRLEMKYNTDLVSWEERLSDLNIKILYYQKICYDLEEKLKKAASIMRYLSNFFKHMIETNDFLLDEQKVFHTGSGKHTNLNEAEARKQISDLESFLNEYETIYEHKNLSRKLLTVNTKNEESSNIDQNKNSITSAAFKSKVNNETDYSKYSVAMKQLSENNTEKYEKLENVFHTTELPTKHHEVQDSKLHIEQPRQEIKLKEDINTILGNYQQQHLESTKKNTNLRLIESVTTNKGVGVCDIDNSEQNKRYFILQEENKTLFHLLQESKENHDLEIKSLISDYESKIQKLEEERKLVGFGNIVDKKAHKINETAEQMEDLEGRGDAFDKSNETYLKRIQFRDENIKQLRRTYEKEMREQDKKWRLCLDRRLTEEETRHQNELAALARELKFKKEELERLAASAVESGSNSSDLLRRQVLALTRQLTELQVNRCEKCDQKNHASERRMSVCPSRSIQDCTEMEYLRNILYNYMMGKEPLVLARVLCALMKFDENQTKDIVLKEEQKITPFGQLGIR